MESVLFQELLLSPKLGKELGHCFVEADNITSFRVEGGNFEDMMTFVEADLCYGWKTLVNCTDVFEIGGISLIEEESIGAVIAAITIVFVFLAVCVFFLELVSICMFICRL